MSSYVLSLQSGHLYWYWGHKVESDLFAVQSTPSEGKLPNFVGDIVTHSG